MSESIATFLDCPPSEPTNPKEALRANRRVGSVRFDMPENPIPAQITDAGEIKKFFSTFKDVFVPYAGTEQSSSHSLLAFLVSLKEVSTTEGAVIEDMKRHMFSGKVVIERSTDPVFETGEERQPVSPAEAQAFVEFVKLIEFNGTDGQQINDVRQFAKGLKEDEKTSGNFYVELVRSQVGGQPIFRVFHHSVLHCLYVATADEENRIIAVSKRWNEQYLRENPPDVLPLYPLWKVDEDGTQRTMYHFKNGNYPWYGRPDSIAATMPKFYEFQSNDYKNKTTANMFMGHSLIEIEDEDLPHGISEQDARQAGFDGVVDEIEQNFTNKSTDPQSVVVFTRPKGASEAFVFQFQPNTSESWFTATEGKAENDIIKAHSWSRRILGLDVASGLSNNVYLDEYEILSATVIKDGQDTLNAVMNNIILSAAADWFGVDQVSDYSMKFTSPFYEIMRARKEADEQSQGQAQGGNDPEPSTGEQQEQQTQSGSKIPFSFL